jgi:hypothetical protein
VRVDVGDGEIYSTVFPRILLRHGPVIIKTQGLFGNNVSLHAERFQRSTY